MFCMLKISISCLSFKVDIILMTPTGEGLHYITVKNYLHE